MPEGQVLEFNRITKRYGAVTAVADLSVRVEPGVVTGFLGPNGAGKTTSLRMLLGQIRPTSGTATIGGSSYSELRNPLRTVGAVLEEAAYRPRRTASRQLLIAAKGNGIPVTRVGEVLRLVGLQDDADTRLGSYSLGMRQRLAVASALLGDPGVLVLDEPANGLDPEGIRWMRLLMRRLADEGRTVLLSSHVLSEIEQVADNVVVLSKGRAVYSGGIEELADPAGGAVIVDAENRAQLITVLSAAKLNFDVLRSGVTVRDSNSATVGAITATAGVPLTVLQQRGPSLEDVFLDLVYGRRADSPRLDQVANPVAHAPSSDGVTAGDTALAASGLATAGAAAVVAGGVAADADADADAGTEADADGEAATDAGADSAASADADAADHAPAEEETPEVVEAPAEETLEAGGATDSEPEASEAVANDDSATDDTAADGTDTDTDGAGEDDVDSSESDTGLEASGDDEPAAAPASDDEAASGDAPAEADPTDEAPTDEAPTDVDEGGESDTTEQPDDDAAADENSDSGTPEGADLHAAVANLWDRPAAAEPAASEPEASDSEDPGADAESDTASSDDAVTQEPEDDQATADTTGVLPLATEAVSLPLRADSSTFTELITGIPASAASATAEPTTPATEAIAVFAPLMSSDDDEDDAVDDAEDNPQLAAMRTSLSSAASRFFDGPAPDYPYSRTPAETEDAADSEGSSPEADASSEDAEQPSEEGQPEHHDDGHEHEHEGDQHHG